MDEKQFLGKQLVVGQTSLNEEGNVQVHIIKQGKITSATNGSLVIQDLNGPTQIPVSEVDLFIKAPRGEYGIDPNGQTAKNPDFLLVQPGKLSATKTNAGSDGLWKTQERGLLLPAVCVSCGADNRPLHPWRIESVTEKISGVSALTLLAGILVKDRTKYTFYVPICSECKERFERLIRIRNWVVAGGAALLVIGLILWFVAVYQHIGSVDLGAALFILGLLLASLVYLVLGKLGRRLGKFDGQKYKFKNRTFQNRFAVLYPALINLPYNPFQT